MAAEISRRGKPLARPGRITHILAMGTWFKLLPVMATLALVAALVAWSARNPLYADGPRTAPAMAALDR